jgi:hypothetical protein
MLSVAALKYTGRPFNSSWDSLPHAGCAGKGMREQQVSTWLRVTGLQTCRNIPAIGKAALGYQWNLNLPKVKMAIAGHHTSVVTRCSFQFHPRLLLLFEMPIAS